MLKFSIKEKLNNLPKSDYEIVMRNIYKQLGISRTTWSHYLNAEENSQYDIPLIHAIRIANFFGCKADELVNIEIQELNIIELKQTKADNLGLTK